MFFDETLCFRVRSDGSGSSWNDGDSNLDGYGMRPLKSERRWKRMAVYEPMSRAFVLSPRESITSGEGPTNASPACSTLRANSAFSERNPYLRKRIQAVDPMTREGEGHSLPRVDHIHAVFQGDSNDIVLGEIRPDWSETFPDLISLIRLQVRIHESR